jgi:hypothetical protein
MKRLVLLALIVSAPALANLRAPRIERTNPGGSLAPAHGLVVLGEQLTFDCATEHCDVTAAYRVRADTRVWAHTAFVAKEKVKISVTVDGQGIDLTPKPAPAVKRPKLPEPPFTPLGVPDLTPFSFEVDAGEHDLVVKYRQPLGIEEVGHSYMSDGVRVQAKVAAGKAGLFGMSDARSVHCHGGETKPVLALRTKVQGTWVQELRFRGVPDELSCFVGPPKRIPK